MTTHLPDTVRLVDEMPGSGLLGIKDLTLLLGISRPTIYRMIKAGKLTPLKIGSLTRFRVDAVRQLISEASK